MATPKAELLNTLEGMRADLMKLERSNQNLYASAKQLATLYEALSMQVVEVTRLAQGGNRPATPIHRAPSLPPPSIGPTIGRSGGSLSRPNASGGVAAAESGSGGVDHLMAATRRMQEMNQSFNLQYLNLQQSMQQQNRQFTTVSNVMKTKHDTAKASINNVR